MTRGGFGANAAHMNPISNNLHKTDMKSGKIKQISSINNLKVFKKFFRRQ
jgi:hypothetical protein